MNLAVATNAARIICSFFSLFQTFQKPLQIQGIFSVSQIVTNCFEAFISINNFLAGQKTPSEESI
jgi:hypothetical protein